jgi:TfoX/Sxy family transcriptional regulator of competence genes
MPYSEIIADRVREYLSEFPQLEEKRMMGGLIFMLKGKLLAGIMQDELLCRVNPELHDSLVEETGCRPLDGSGKSMKGFILIDQDVLRTGKEFRRWMELALEFNPKAKASKKK